MAGCAAGEHSSGGEGEKLKVGELECLGLATTDTRWGSPQRTARSPPGPQPGAHHTAYTALSAFPPAHSSTLISDASVWTSVTPLPRPRQGRIATCAAEAAPSAWRGQALRPAPACSKLRSSGRVRDVRARARGRMSGGFQPCLAHIRGRQVGYDDFCSLLLAGAGWSRPRIEVQRVAARRARLRRAVLRAGGGTCHLLVVGLQLNILRGYMRTSGTHLQLGYL